MLYLNEPRFWASLAPSYEGTPPLPALLNAMYLVGCHLSEDPLLMTLEAHYLTRTRQLLVNSLGDTSLSLVQWLQASCLLTYYLMRKCRFLEARQEVSYISLHYPPERRPDAQRFPSIAGRNSTARPSLRAAQDNVTRLEEPGLQVQLPVTTANG